MHVAYMSRRVQGFWLVQRYLNSHWSCFGNKEIRGTFEKGMRGAYARNWSLDDGGTEERADGGRSQ